MLCSIMRYSLSLPAGVLILLAAGAAPAWSELIRQWSFDGTFEERVAGDHGVAVNGPSFAPRTGIIATGAVVFDGARQQFVNIPGGGGLDGLETGTISFNLRWNGVQDSSCCHSHGNVMGRQSDGGFSNHVIGLSNAGPAGAVITWQPYDSGPPAIVGTTTVGEGTWHHVAITFTPGRHVLYLNGRIEGVSEVKGTMTSDPNVPLSIGAWVGAGAGFSSAVIDEVRIYDVALTAPQVRSLPVAVNAMTLSENVVLSRPREGDVIGTLATPQGDPDDTFTYSLVPGAGGSSNGLFQIVGNELQVRDAQGVAAGSGFFGVSSVRIEATGTPSGETFTSFFHLTSMTDSDADNLPDEWELIFTSQLTDLTGEADTDGDGLTDREEFNLHTGPILGLGSAHGIDPTRWDTDGDGLSDLEEVLGAENRPPTDAVNADTDGDGFSDLNETATGTYLSALDTGSDPTVFDLSVAAPPLRWEISQDGATGNLHISWDSREGALYNIRSVENPPGGQLSDWPIFADFMNLKPTLPRNTITLPLPAEDTRFFVIEEIAESPPIVFSEDFEGDLEAWSNGSDGEPGTAWEYGTPSAGVLEAHGGLRCVGTNLTANYDVDANVWLRSPVIDLRNAKRATLSYWEFREIEILFDSGSVRVLDVEDGSDLGVVARAIDGNSLGWERVSHFIPISALGKQVRLEFVFQSDDLFNFSGWYIDDLEVSVTR